MAQLADGWPFPSGPLSLTFLPIQRFVSGAERVCQRHRSDLLSSTEYQETRKDSEVQKENKTTNNVLLVLHRYLIQAHIYFPKDMII